MKKILLLTTLIFGLQMASHAQSDAKNTAAISFYIVNMHEDLGPLMNNALYDSVYNRLASAIDQGTDYRVLHKDALRNQVRYHRMGYPMATGKKAAKTGVANYYIRLLVTANPSGIATGTSKSAGNKKLAVGTEKMKAKVKIQVKATVYDDKGAKVKNIKVDSVTSDKIEITQNVVIFGTLSHHSFNQQITDNSSFDALISDVAQKLAKALK